MEDELELRAWESKFSFLLFLSQCFHATPYITCYLTILRVNSGYFSNIICNYNSMLLNIWTEIIKFSYDPISTISPTVPRIACDILFLNTIPNDPISFFSWQTPKMQLLVKKRLREFFRIIRLQNDCRFHHTEKLKSAAAKKDLSRNNSNKWFLAIIFKSWRLLYSF